MAAVSGGIDSMVLLHLLIRLRERVGLRLVVVHVHHGLRGRSAEQDAACVRSAAAAAGIPCHVERLRPAERARGTSVQEWGRAGRYACLEAVRCAEGAGWIVTAHTRDDQAETLLLNLLRGTGPRGLAGIPEVRGPIIRPLLAVSRGQIESYAVRWSVPHREDPSNATDVYRRNRIRHALLPLLAREYNPRVADALADLASQIREDLAVLDGAARRLASRAIRERGEAVGLDVPTLARAEPALGRRLFITAFRRVAGDTAGLTRRHLAGLLGLVSGGGEVRLPGGVSATRAQQTVWMARRRPQPPPGEAPAAPVPVAVGQWTPWAPGGCEIRVRRILAPGLRRRGTGRRELLSPAVFALPLAIRTWRPGDRFQPLGLAGVKKLQDFFVDSRIPRDVRGRIPLLIAGERIAWVVGHRIAEPFRWAGEPVACLAEVRYGGHSQ